MPKAAMHGAGFVLVMLLLVAALCGCDETNVYQPPPPPEVTVAHPIERPIKDSFDFTGTTRAVQRVELRPRVSGHLLQIEFDDGQTVEEGKELFVIDPAPFEAQLHAAEAQLSKARAALQLARANLERTQELFRRKVTTQQELDVQKAEVDTAEAEVDVANAAIEQAKLQLGYSVINAPISGRIGQHLVDVGNLIQVEETLAVIESTGKIHAYFTVSERDLLRFMEMLRRNEVADPTKQRITLYLGLANETGFPHVGYLDYRELGVDPSTGTVLRRGIFDNENNELIPGLFVRIRATPGEPIERVLIDERAIGSDQTGEFVLVVNGENKVEQRSVKTGVAVDGLRVIEKGLQTSDRVVVNGLQRARPGAVVKPIEAAADAQQVARSPGGDKAASDDASSDEASSNEASAEDSTGTKTSSQQQTATAKRGSSR
jgi:RND family efflux transporter MFP subunit